MSVTTNLGLTKQAFGAPLWDTPLNTNFDVLDALFTGGFGSAVLKRSAGGTGVDLSATGGAGKYLKQLTAGGAITVAVIDGADIPAMGASGVDHKAGAVPDPGSSAGTTHFLREDATWAVPPTFSITDSGNKVFASPNDGSSGTFAARVLVAADIPNLAASKITSGTVAVSVGGTGLASYTTGDIVYASGGTTLAKRAIGTTGQILKVSGGVPVWADLAIADSDLSFTDITTNNVSITKHGFAPKLPNDATKFLNGVGGYTVPSRVSAIEFVIDGSGSVPDTGVYGQFSLPVACTIVGWNITGDVSGSAVVDILRSTGGSFPSTFSIAGYDKPTLSSAQRAHDVTLSGWGSTALAQYDELQVALDSVTTCTRLNVTLYVTIP